MFKKYHFFYLVLISLSGFSQNTFVPDDNFEMYLETHNSNFDLVSLGDPNSLGDGIMNDNIPTNKINTILSIDLENNNIADLTGIEDFSELVELYCQNNNLTTINIAQNLKLRTFWCFDNSLSSLDIAQNIILRALACHNNNLNNINTSNNPELRVLACENNQITNLNLSNNIELNRLTCSNNLLSVLNLNNNLNLNYFDCSFNLLNELNLTNNISLGTLICSNNNLSELDLSNNPNLLLLECHNNQLCNLNVNSGNNDRLTSLDFSSNPGLTCVIVDSPNSINSNWQPISFTNYVSSAEECSNQILVDELDNFVGTSYTLPSLLNGMYYTESGGNGTQLFPGQAILTSQTIYIYNSVNDCYFNESSFNITIFSGEYLIPKFFTPNNDNYNDTWIVYDSTGMFTSINIFDRYGKLLKTLLPGNFEWDGRFNGNLMETNDYWFVINRDANIPLKGHFTLKR